MLSSLFFGRRFFSTLIVVITTANVNADNHSKPNLGNLVSTSELAGLSLTVFPDGRGLPPGSGNAIDGATVYQTHCLACHGTEGQGGINAALSGGIGTLVSTRPNKTVGSFWPYATSLFDYVRRAMPYNAPGSLDEDELYAVTAYLLYVNRIISATAVMNATVLPTITMPNRDGFDWPEGTPLPKHPSTDLGGNSQR